ncbi:MAG: peptide chain release factor N(5)-glutamine methyltransferase [Thermotaleaceae bacterium]
MGMTVGETLKNAADQLSEKKARTPLLDAEVLLCAVLKLDRLYLYIQRNRQLTEKEEEDFKSMLTKRLEGMPVQYILGHQEFMGLDFYVEEGVLIPRPDTEILVETVLGWVKEKGLSKADVPPWTIVDLGTGSGAITVSLAKYIPNSALYSVDISQRALAIGEKNAVHNGVAGQIRFLEGDLFQPLEEKGLEGKIDILVSNPPYIPRRDIEGLQVEVAGYEPVLALDGGEDGLDFYRRIIAEGLRFLRQGGFMALEVGHDQAETVMSLMKERGSYGHIQKHKDLAGIERVVTAENV